MDLTSVPAIDSANLQTLSAYLNAPSPRADTNTFASANSDARVRRAVAEDLPASVLDSKTLRSVTYTLSATVLDTSDWWADAIALASTVLHAIGSYDPSALANAVGNDLSV